MTGWLMRRLPAGGFVWLLVHELRLGLRQNTRSTRAKVIVYGFLLVLVASGVTLAYVLRNTPIPTGPTERIAVLTGAIVGGSFMVTQAMLAAQRALYQSGDSDLLFSAPIAPRSVILAKLSGIAGTVVLSYAFVALPLVVPLVILNHPGLLGLFALILACALSAACFGLALTLLIARIAGPRTARTVGQIIAGLLGGAMFLISQLMNSSGKRESRIQVIFERVRDSGVADGWWGGLPGRAALGDPVAIVVLLGGACAIFAVTGILFRRWFVRGVADAGQHLSRSKISRRGIERHFRARLFAAVLRKETRLLLRQPVIAFQIVLRLTYLLVLLYVGVSNSDTVPIAPGLAFLSVAIAGQLVGSFTWLAVQAEAAPDLLVVAPVDKAVIARLKLFSAMLIAAPIAVLLPIAIALQTPLGALVTILATALGGAAAGFVELKLGKPPAGSGLNRRRPGSVLTRIVTLVITGAIGLVTGAIVYFLP